MTTTEVSVLGPLQVRADGVSVTMPGRRPAALLAVLALAEGRTVSIDELARGVWGDELPDSVKGSLQTYVGRLRRVLGETAVRTEPAGYRLDVPAENVDVTRFGRLVDTAAEADPVDAAARLDEALDLWRGEPLAGLSEWIERNDRPALIERYLAAVERRVDLWLAAGEHGAAIVALRPLVEQHPLRETLWARLLTALRHANRVAEALELYESVRQRLAGELGVDPSPELRDLHLALVTAGEGGQSGTSPVPATPRELPAVPSGFVGREPELTRMDAVLTPAGVHQVIVLHGPGGSGKTTLAVRWGQRTAESFPDGQVMVNLRGHGPGAPLGTAAALDHLLRGSGVPDAEVPVDIDAAGALLRTTLAERRVLIVLDDARTADQVRPLLPGGPSVVVVTSRSEMRGLVAREAAARVEVGPLSTTEAVRLLDSRLGTDATSAPRPEELRELAALCGHLPVALGIAAERAGRGGANGLVALLETLRDKDERLSALRSGDDVTANVRAVFDASYHHLDNDSAVMYRRLGLHTDTTVSVPTAAALMGVSVRRADDLLDRLAEYHLVEPRSPEWYGMHDLVRDHAIDMAHRLDVDADRAAVTMRARSWYLHTAQNAVQMFSANPPERLAGPPAPGVEPQTFAGHHTALAWFADHRRGLRSAFDAVLADRQLVWAEHLAAVMAAFCDTRGAYDERVRMFDQLAPLAGAAGDDAVLGRCLTARGIYLGRRGDHESALAAFERARELGVAAGDRDGTLRAVYNLATTSEYLGRPEEAVPLMELVVAGRRENGDAVLVLNAWQKLAQTYLHAGRLPEAETAATDLLAECRDSGNEAWSAARALETLAEVALKRGDLEEIEGRYAEAIAIYVSLGGDYDVACVTYELAKAQLDLGRPERAPDNLRRALDIITAVGASDTEEMNRAGLEAMLTAIEGRRETANRDTAM